MVSTETGVKSSVGFLPGVKQIRIDNEMIKYLFMTKKDWGGKSWHLKLRALIWCSVLLMEVSLDNLNSERTAWAQMPEDVVVLPRQQPTVRSIGDVFRDCPDCPEMVILPPGSFLMGGLDPFRMLLPNFESIHIELVFRLQTVVFPTTDPSRPIRQQHRFGGYLISM